MVGRAGTPRGPAFDQLDDWREHGMATRRGAQAGPTPQVTSERAVRVASRRPHRLTESEKTSLTATVITLLGLREMLAETAARFPKGSAVRAAIECVVTDRLGPALADLRALLGPAVAPAVAPAGTEVGAADRDTNGDPAGA
jgi:hypothetical protein